jgi:nucleoside-diphosphate-sugar epimerase
VAMTRTPAKAERLRALGAEPVVADGLDRKAVVEAVVRAEPEVVIHQMTALKGLSNFKRFDREFEVTNRLRTQGLDYLMEGARLGGVRRVVAQSFGGWNYERTGGSVKTEDDPLDPNPPKAMSRTLEAIRYLEDTVLGDEHVEGVALRYGGFYGPGTMLGEGGDMLDQLRKRKLPIIGDGEGVWSFIHVDDGAAATVLAMTQGAPGIYNVADDEPAPVKVWLPEMAAVAGAKPPRHIPAWIGKLVVGEPGISMFTKVRGISNAKAKRELGWELIYPSWREGIRHGLSAQPLGGRRVGFPKLGGEHSSQLST